MFGSVSRWRLKEGTTDEQLRELTEAMRSNRPPGSVALLLFRSVNDPREVWVAGVFESREVYERNAQSPEQNQRFERARALMDGTPQWHDGDVLLAMADSKVAVD